MKRLFKFLPVVIPIAVKAVKSPQGQKVIAQIRTRVGGSKTGAATPKR